VGLLEFAIGLAVPVTVRRSHDQQDPQQGQPHQQQQQQQQQLPLEQAKLLKPRDSDAVLSCPRCFTIVCMDCQQHDTYQNQYRAMFVMNICLTYKLIYDTHSKQLVELSSTTRGKTMDDHDGEGDADEIYYSVHCLQRKTQAAAALDMKEEIYHFFSDVWRPPEPKQEVPSSLPTYELAERQRIAMIILHTYIQVLHTFSRKKHYNIAFQPKRCIWISSYNIQNQFFSLSRSILYQEGKV
jgi:hypothetical protein